MTDLNIVGANIKKFRTLKTCTQSQLAQVLSVSQQTIQRYESGEIKNIPLPHIEKIAAYLGVRPQDITGWSNNQNAATQNSNDMPDGIISSKSSGVVVIEEMKNGPQIVRLARLAKSLSDEDLKNLVSLTESLAKKKGSRKSGGVDDDI